MVQLGKLCNHLIPAANQPLEVADQQVRCFQLFQNRDFVFHKLGIENVIAVPEFAVQSVTHESVGFIHFQPQAALAMAGGQRENVQIANVNILVCDGAHLDMAFGFRGYKSFLNIQLPDIAGVILMEMGQDNIVMICQFGNRPFIASHIVKPYGIPIPNDTDVCRQRII